MVKPARRRRKRMREYAKRADLCRFWFGYGLSRNSVVKKTWGRGKFSEGGMLG